MYLVPKSKEEVVKRYQECDQRVTGGQKLEVGYIRKDNFRVELGFNSNEEEVVPKVDDVSLVDGVFYGAFGGDGEEDFVVGEGVRRKLGWNPWKWKKSKEDECEDDEDGEDKD
ncbi:hypothetical protein Tco_0832377 [Tanacetum coccineum]